MGGEPFLEFQTLVKSVHLCNILGLKASVVTNGFWADTEEHAHTIVGELQGLTTLCVSTDIFHQEFVPIENVRHVILACHDLGIECQVYFCHLDNPESEVEEIKHQLEGLEHCYELQQQPVIFIGRAVKELDINSIFSYDPRRVTCEIIDSPLVTCNGTVIACCGAAIIWPGDHLLQIGNVHTQSLSEIRRAADRNPVIHAIRLGGPGYLVQVVEEQAGKEGCAFIPPSVEETRDVCSLCRYILMNKDHAGLLQRAIKDPEIYRRIAVGRLIKFAEISMLVEESELPIKTVSTGECRNE